MRVTRRDRAQRAENDVGGVDTVSFSALASAAPTIGIQKRYQGGFVA
jgi:hypothetical protein